MPISSANRNKTVLLPKGRQRPTFQGDYVKAPKDKEGWKKFLFERDEKDYWKKNQAFDFLQVVPHHLADGVIFTCPHLGHPEHAHVLWGNHIGVGLQPGPGRIDAAAMRFRGEVVFLQKSPNASLAGRCLCQLACGVRMTVVNNELLWCE